MANKYIIHGATYCGDGTASNEAASAGAAGAWNDINVFEGTAPAYGTAPAAGDTVYIRSKTSAGADITRTLAANVTLGSAAATAASWVTWVLDGGTIWSGINGTLTYSCPSSYTVTQRSYNDIRAEIQDHFVVALPSISSNISRVVFNTDCKNKNLFIDFSLNTSAYGDQVYLPGGEVTSENLHLKVPHYYQSPFSIGSSVKATLVNPQLEMILAPGGTDSLNAIIGIGQYGSSLTIIGGAVYGAGATTGAYLITGYTTSAGATLIGTQVPKALALARNAASLGFMRVEATGLDGGSGGAVYDVWGMADSRSDGYYPTLNAFFPDSANTPWAWKIYPSTAGVKNPFVLSTAKVFTDSAAVKTITAYALVADSITTANAGTLWIDVIYVDDSTGLPVMLSSKDISSPSLGGDTAAWTLTYGLDTTKVSIPLVGLFSKKHMSVTTPTAIKQNTPVIINLCGTVKAASALDLIFYCPDASIA